MCSLLSFSSKDKLLNVLKAQLYNRKLLLFNIKINQEIQGLIWRMENNPIFERLCLWHKSACQRQQQLNDVESHVQLIYWGGELMYFVIRANPLNLRCFERFCLFLAVLSALQIKVCPIVWSRARLLLLGMKINGN